MELIQEHKGKKTKIAIVGGNAKAVILSGGGSASLKPSYFVSPYDGIVNALPEGVEVLYSEGARGRITAVEIVILTDFF
jgi:beta-glucosidase